MQYAARQRVLQGVGRSVHQFCHEEHAQYGIKPCMMEHRGFEIRMADMRQSADGDENSNSQHTEHRTPQATVSPVIVLTVCVEPDDLKHTGRHEKAAQPVERDEWHLMGHHAPSVGAGVNDKHDDEHQSYRQPVHHLPRVEGHDEPQVYPVAQRHGQQDDDIDGG